MKPIDILRLCGAVAPTLLVSLDFKNGVYSIGGVSKTLAEVCEQDLDWGPYSSASVVGGTGLRSTSGSVNPTLTSAASAAVLAGGSFTAVVAFTLALTGTGNASIDVDTFEATVTDDWGFGARLNPNSSTATGTLFDFDATFETIPLSGAGAHKGAATLGPTHLAGAIDGGSVVVTGTPQTMTPVQVGLGLFTSGTATAVIERVDFYSAVADGALVALSA
jgi:hypothetical protein